MSALAIPPVKHLSYSQVSTLRTCGEKFRLERIWRVPQVPSWAQVGGNAFHNWTQDWDLAQVSGAEAPHPDDFASYMEAEAEERAEKDGFPQEQFKAFGRATKEWPNKENKAWWLANGLAMCRRWIAWRNTAPLDLWIAETGEPGIEVEIKATLGKAEVVGFVDRVFRDLRDGGLVVVDIKSGSRKIVNDGQLGIYKIGLRQKFGDLPIRYGAYWYSREGGTSQFFPLNEWSERRARWEYEAALKRRESGDFQPNVADHCGWCGVRDFCLYVGGERASEIRPMWVGEDEWQEAAE